MSSWFLFGVVGAWVGVGSGAIHAITWAVHDIREAKARRDNVPLPRRWNIIALTVTFVPTALWIGLSFHPLVEASWMVFGLIGFLVGFAWTRVVLEDAGMAPHW